VRDDDAPAIVAACGDEDILRFIPGMPSPYTEEMARGFLARVQQRWGEGASYTFAIADRESDELLGLIEIRPDSGTRSDVGYWVAPHARGRGAATDALRAIVEWTRREHGTGTIELVTHLDNEASQRVAEKAGFRRLGTIDREERFRDGSTMVAVFANEA
jgi:RimJ/RimL family protein N-acetyltransferase